MWPSDTYMMAGPGGFTLQTAAMKRCNNQPDKLGFEMREQYILSYFYLRDDAEFALDRTNTRQSNADPAPPPMQETNNSTIT
jgi:hypothetical protein